jgi:peptide/nickel transport system substrate-binding protein
MKRGTIWIVLTCLIVASLVLVSCNKTTTNTIVTSSTTSTTQTTKTTAANATTTTATSVTITTTTAASGNWWDSLPKPQYGGTLTIRQNRDVVSFDPYNGESVTTIESAWLERLFADDWTLDPATFNYKIDFRSNEVTKGQLVEKWEFTDPSTLVLSLRKGIHWQNIAPVNGREFVASDVVFHFNRLYGLGSGYTKAAPAAAADPKSTDMISATATDKYTVVLKFKSTNAEITTETMEAQSGNSMDIEAPEVVQQWGNLNDWHHAIGTGPFILTDFISGSSATLIRNPDYWGYDERNPQNKLPYIDGLRFLIIPDDNTALAGLRAGKIDILDNLSLIQGQGLQKSNPELLYVNNYLPDTNTVDPRNDTKPFSDIRVREAMQKAIDLPTIASTYYAGAADPWPSTEISNYMPDYGFHYNVWPQDLKDQYTYDPKAAKQLLADAGYPNGFKTDIVVSSDSDLNLLQIVQSYFSAVGINMEIRTMDPAAWQNFVRVARSQDQMSMRAAGGLGHTFQPSRLLIRYTGSYTANEISVNDPVFNSFYPKAMATTNSTDFRKVISDMDEYIAQQHYHISLLQPKLYNFYQPWVNGYAAQSKSISGGGAGPQLLFFYPARFWIDSNLKESLGH